MSRKRVKEVPTPSLECFDNFTLEVRTHNHLPAKLLVVSAGIIATRHDTGENAPRGGRNYSYDATAVGGRSHSKWASDKPWSGVVGP